QDEEDERDEQDGIARHSCSMDKWLESKNSQSTRLIVASAILSILFIPFILSKKFNGPRAQRVGSARINGHSCWSSGDPSPEADR
ncbi:MAG: hypothetical protein NT069_04945, partial [Planctomycetota bacterium]|nr:hypothetical protein [Planctomycetota bacterium]